MQTECNTALFDFAPVEERRVVASFNGGMMTSDAGALLLGRTDKAARLVERAAGCFIYRRDLALIEHSLATLVGNGFLVWRWAMRISTITPPCGTIRERSP